MNITTCTFHNVLGPSVELNTDRMPLKVFETSVDTRQDDRPKVSQHGTWPVFTYEGRRTFDLEGDIVGQDTADYTRRRMELVSAFTPAPEFGYRYVGTLNLGIDGINELMSIECGINGLPLAPVDASTGAPDVGPYMISLVADNPILYGANPQVFATGTPVGGVGGRTYPMTYNYHYLAGGGTGDTLVTNNGAVAVKPVVVINGPSSGQSLTITIGTQQLTLSLDGLILGDGEYVVIDFENRTVTTNSGGSAYWAIGRDTTWWAIPPGTYTVTYRAGTALAPSHAEITLKNGYMI